MEKIKEQFKKVIEYSQGIEDPKVDQLFEAWQCNKYVWRNLFKGELIYEHPQKVSIPFTLEEKQVRLKEFITKLYDYYGFYNLSCFLEANAEGFFDNRVVSIEGYEEYSNIRIGAKLLKTFKWFVSDSKWLRKIQDEASMIIQEDKVEGYVCLSIHPLDFLSTSENTLNWRSCHALDGDYKAGNLSYMADASTCVAYIKTDKNVKLPNFPLSVPWNNKKWRTLLFLSNDGNMLFAGRSYPYSNMNILNMVHSIFTDLYYNKFYSHRIWHPSWSVWHNYYITEFPYGDMKADLDVNYVWLTDSRLIAMDELIKDESTLHFNDLIGSSIYLKPYYSTLGGEATTAETRFYIGAPVKCMHCGEQYIDEHYYMRCPDCEEKYGKLENDDFCFCVSCNRHLRTENAVWVNEETVGLCHSCAKESAAKCDCCGGKFLLNDLLPYNENEIRCNNCRKEN